jgi:DNA-binding HxlR family transcriptional regulator
LAVRELLSRIGDKWTIFVVLSLDLLGGRARFSELERAVPGISQRMLSVTLKSLERDGLVTREVFAQVPPRVDYEITDLGRSLLTPTQGLVDWAKAHWERCAPRKAAMMRHKRRRPEQGGRAWRRFGIETHGGA